MTPSYAVHAPGPLDNGTITPSAALASMPYAPAQSLAFLDELYCRHGGELWGEYGFYDAFNLKEDWVPHSYLAIDQGPIAPMIENYRTGLCWKIFMKAPEIRKAVNLMKGTNRPRD